MVGREKDGIWITLKEEIHAAPAEVASCISSAAGFCRWLAVGCDITVDDRGARDDRNAADDRSSGESGHARDRHEDSSGERALLSIAWDRAWNHTTEALILEHDIAAVADGCARIKFEWFPSPVDDTPVPIEIVVAPLAERGDGTAGARVILRHGPFAEETDNLLFMADSAESWRWYLCNLRSVLEAKHDMRAVRPL